MTKTYGNLNDRKTYQCEKCKEWFRIKLTLDKHKCVKENYFKNQEEIK